MFRGRTTTKIHRILKFSIFYAPLVSFREISCHTFGITNSQIQSELYWYLTRMYNYNRTINSVEFSLEHICNTIITAKNSFGYIRQYYVYKHSGQIFEVRLVFRQNDGFSYFLEDLGCPIAIPSVIR